ncbi:ankyrin repeat domain-containing protein [Aromatoleum bremense]|uniref:Ankyrin repeat domain-containing protein n=1 Tax=Aromatoleum bremense TaxID=76115 RepID=A0ABX1NSH6_9RHOO|nr:ankyrin repeat domain-containing protein [Aromatoleum bremense]NMG14858.1 ankyrin repeat domain-containing protein [Aromatoleum bremense]QTQ32138.1 Ankyrin repeat domain-containing protein [Aromatoleum bremense]
MNDMADKGPMAAHLEQALLDAVRTGNAQEVLRRLDDGLSFAWRDAEGCSALFHAVYRRQWKVVDALLARGASIDLPDFRGWTPLFWAAFNGHADIVMFLISRGADPDVRTAEGEWPLFWAVYKGHMAVVRHLLIGGARRDLLDGDGHDVLWLARTLKRREFVAMLEGQRRRHGISRAQPDET